jgi:hypothetical protein
MRQPRPSSFEIVRPLESTVKQSPNDRYRNKGGSAAFGRSAPIDQGVQCDPNQSFEPHLNAGVKPMPACEARWQPNSGLSGAQIDVKTYILAKGAKS